MYWSMEIKLNQGYSLKLNDQIYVAINEPKSLDLEPVNLDLDIVYEDSYLLVVNKPEGLVVHPAESYDGPTLYMVFYIKVTN